MKQVVFFLFGEQYGNYLLETNIAYYMLAGLLAIIVVVLLILVIHMIKSIRLEKAGSSEDDYPEELPDFRQNAGIPQQPGPGSIPIQPGPTPIQPIPHGQPTGQQPGAAPMQTSTFRQMPQGQPMGQQTAESAQPQPGQRPFRQIPQGQPTAQQPAPIQTSTFRQAPQGQPTAPQQPTPIQTSTFRQAPQGQPTAQQPAPIQTSKLQPASRPFMKEGFLPSVDDKPGMIPNPLPVPPQKIRKANDYDIEVSDNDDYDIK